MSFENDDDDFFDDENFDMGDPDNDTDYLPNTNFVKSDEDGKSISAPNKTKLAVFRAYSSSRKKISALSAKYPNAVRHAITICESIIDFYRRRNYFTILRGGFEIFETIQAANLYNFYQFVRAADGFRYLSVNRVNIGFLFKDTMEKFPKEKITFKNNETCDHITLALGDIYIYSPGNETFIYYNQNLIKKEELVKFLIDEKFKDLDSQFLYLQVEENKPGLTLSSWCPELLPSKKADELGKMLQQFNEININRSILLFGVPGVGKTSMAFKMLNDLKYRTIVFSASNKLVSFDLIKNLIDMLQIDAIIIDDFDQFNQTNKTLDILEMFNRRCKVLIGIANTLKEFNVSILRPGRFDEVIMIDELDEECVKKVLGKKHASYLDRVRKWPIAFATELVKKGQFLTKKEMENYAEELEFRIRRQVGSYAVATPLKKKGRKNSARKNTLPIEVGEDGWTEGEWDEIYDEGPF